MRINVSIDSAAVQTKLRSLAGEFMPKARKAISVALQREADDLKKEVREHVASRMKVLKKSFPKSFSTKVLDKKPERLPALYVG